MEPNDPANHPANEPDKAAAKGADAAPSARTPATTKGRSSDPTKANAQPAGESGTVMGWRLPGERLTPAGWAVLVAVFLLPVLGIGLVLDALVQLAFGWCLGVWCWF